ncbi:MAG: TerB family tellurite resistance protein [Candidatus Binatia bacterium]
MIRIPNFGCLIFLLLMALVGGAPLMVGVARVALFFIVTSVVLGMVGRWYLQRRAVPFHAQDGNLRHDRYFQTMIALLVRLAEIDRSLDRREVTVIRHFFQRELRYNDEKLLWVRDRIQEARSSTVPVAELCALLVREYDLQARYIVVQMLGRVARADGAMSPAEAAMLQDIVRQLGLAPFLADFQFQWQQGFEQAGGRSAPPPDRTAEAFAILGLSPGASPAEIKQAWRELSKEHHPDRVTHLGEELRGEAEQRMRRINAAYDTLKAAGLAQ